MFVSQSRLLEQCLIDITNKVLGEQLDKENRVLILNRIKEITLNVFQQRYQDEINLLQQQLRHQQQLQERLKQEQEDQTQLITIDLETKLRESQIEQVKELKAMQQIIDKHVNQQDNLQKKLKELTTINNELKIKISQQNDQIQVSEEQLELQQIQSEKYKQKLDQVNQTIILMEQQNKTIKQEMEKQIKELQKNSQNNITIQAEFDNLKIEYEQIKNKRQQESQKNKEALELLKEKSNNKIKEYKVKLKEQETLQQKIIDLTEQHKELEQQLEFQQSQHRSTLKLVEQQYKKQIELIEQNLEKEKNDHLDEYEYKIKQLEQSIQEQTIEINRLKIQLKQEQDLRKKNQIQNDQNLVSLNQESNEKEDLIQSLNQQIQELQVDNKKKEDNIKLLLHDIDDVKQFSEQTLNTLKENQEFLNELEREKQQQFEIIQNIQQQLEIEIQGSFSYKRIGEELEQKCKLYKEEHQKLLEEQLQQQAEYQNYLQTIQTNSLQDIDKLKIQYDQKCQNFENLIQKQKIETKLISEESSRSITLLQQEILNKQSQLDIFEKQNIQLVGELEQYIKEYTNVLQKMEEMKQNEKRILEQQNKNISNWNTEKHQLMLVIDEQQFKNKQLKQKMQRITNRLKEQFGLQLIEFKSQIVSKLKTFDNDNKLMIQTTFKQIVQIIEIKLQGEKKVLEDTKKEMERKIEALKKQNKQNEFLIQEEAQIKFKQQYQNTEQMQGELKDKLNYYMEENEHLSKKLEIQDQLFKEQQKKYSIESNQLQDTMKELQSELYEAQQTADFQIKEKIYYEQRYNDLKEKSEKNYDKISKDYQQQIQQLETIIQPNSRAVSPPMHMHSSSGFQHRSSTQTNLSSTSKTLFNRLPNQYSSPITKTPHKSPLNERTDKTIEELRQEIQQQKEKLSRMKLNFTESQKKQKNKF